MNDVTYRHCIVYRMKLARGMLQCARCRMRCHRRRQPRRQLLCSTAYFACGSLLGAVQRMVQHLRRHLIRFLEMRDLPVEGQCSFLGFCGIFDCKSAGVNGDDCDMDRPWEEAVEQGSPKFTGGDACGAPQTLCRCGSDGYLRPGYPNDAAAAGLIRGEGGKVRMATAQTIPKRGHWKCFWTATFSAASQWR
ncbi:hypothetical protein TraAM80_09015 [Trypanosoma rangeli]|uniref:Uncharacterized protein n=1 Tax=Trypanosoma rangeli TaxID=5698 RepID=A0A3R7M8E3_TRYRA|nr:uncharacterized protein TraAM80_09015 [Trypanosoma rangeli]RNE98028.1 hypothetical protein TraAM80_09015 [Trypanosoma rangeli]|eukprot:RNE98028.1 hypothetical protein TraAM80_09015 [Trypanosoma rangeli]